MASAKGTFDDLRVMAATALLLDIAALAILALVPLARPLGLGDLEIPASAAFGWMLLGIPLLLASVAFVGIVARIARLTGERLMQSAFCTCLLAWLLAVSLALSSDLPAGDAGQMRRFAIVAFSLYSMNLLVLWRPALARVGGEKDQRPDAEG